MFRNAEGHMSDTPANRQLLTDVANNPKLVAGTNSWGVTESSLTRADGTQVWVGVRNGQIQYGGLNQTPRAWDPVSGFSSPVKPKQ
jgi:filamentous hemagglutinin